MELDRATDFSPAPPASSEFGDGQDATTTPMTLDELGEPWNAPQRAREGRGCAGLRTGAGRSRLPREPLSAQPAPLRMRSYSPLAFSSASSSVRALRRSLIAASCGCHSRYRYESARIDGLLMLKPPGRLGNGYSKKHDRQTRPKRTSLSNAISTMCRTRARLKNTGCSVSPAGNSRNTLPIWPGV